jgi:hypothetical protein
VSCREISRDEFDRIIPVRPPTVKRKINPKAHINGTSPLTMEPVKVAIQLKTLTPVGTAIIIVAAVK